MGEFIAYLQDVFSKFGNIVSKRMFGGYGVYHDEVMFGLVVDDTLYLKADEENIHFFAERDLPPFEYSRSGKMVKLSYYQAPDELFDDADEAKKWADHSFAAALRAKGIKKKR